MFVRFKKMCWTRPVVQTTTTSTPKSPTGTVIAVGRCAATIAVDDTHRQFYASFEEWGDQLRVGDVVPFRIDTGRVAGRHVVGKCTYDRHHCVPIDTAREERDVDSHSI